MALITAELQEHEKTTVPALQKQLKMSCINTLIQRKASEADDSRNGGQRVPVLEQNLSCFLEQTSFPSLPPDTALKSVDRDTSISIAQTSATRHNRDPSMAGKSYKKALQ